MDFDTEFKKYSQRVADASSKISGKTIAKIESCHDEAGDFYFTIDFVDGSSAVVKGAAYWDYQQCFAEVRAS
jgi:hypothetical protein